MYEVCITCPKLGKPRNGPNFSALSTTARLDWIKKRKNFLGWTNAKLAEESNTPKGTIGSLLSGNRTGANTETLRPIFEALIGGYDNGKPCPNPPTQEDIAIEQKVREQEQVICELQNDIDKKNERINDLEAEVGRLKDHIRNTNGLHVADKSNAVAEYRDAYLFHRKLVAILATLLIILLTVFAVALFVDKTNPDVGFFWLEETLAFFTKDHTGSLAEHISNALRV